MDNIQNITKIASVTNNNDEDEKLKAILLSKHKNHVEAFTYHCISVQDMYDEAIRELEASSAGELDLKYDQKRYVLDTFVELQNNLKKYTLEMKKVFSCYYFMSDMTLQKLESRACKRSASSENEDDLHSWTIKEYGNKYSKINKEILLSEKDILENTVSPIVLQWYENEFIQEENSFPPREKHNILKTTCREGIKTCLSYTDNHVDLLKSTFDQLDLKLDQLFEKFNEKRLIPLKMTSNNQSFESYTLKRQQPTISRVPGYIPTLLNEVTPTLAIEFDSSGIKCGVIGEGKLLIMANENNQMHFPFSVDFDKKDEILLNGKLQESFNTNWDFIHSMKQMHNNINIQAKAPNGDVLDVGEELICALALEKVKRQAEMTLGREIEQTTIAIPLRYTTTKRLSIKDAAEIAGFKKVSLITETTAAAIAYFRNNRKTAEELRKTLLVLVHSKGHYDAAAFKMENGVVQMITCTGDCHNHKRNDERLAKHIVRKFKKTPVSVMIYGGNDQAVAASISQQLSCKLEPVKSPILLGAAKYSELNSENRIFLDLYPYKLKLKYSISKTAILKFPRRSNCNETNYLRVNLRTAKTSQSEKDKAIITVEQGRSTFTTGQFSINGDHVLCNLDQEGILTILHDNVPISNSFSLAPREKEMCSSFLRRKINQEELRNLAEFLSKSSASISKDFVREEIAIEVEAAMEFLKNGASSPEILQHKISFLKELKDKYAS